MQIKYLSGTFRTHVCMSAYFYVCNLILLKPIMLVLVQVCTVVHLYINGTIIYSLNFSDSLT